MRSRRCGDCGEAIAAKRLAAVPSTPWCVTCAERHVERVGGVMRIRDEVPELEVVRSVAWARVVARGESRAAALGLEPPVESR